MSWLQIIAITVVILLYGTLAYSLGYGHAQMDVSIKAINESLDRIAADREKR